MAKFESRSYSGKTLRPKPDVYFDEDQSLFIIATAWGAPESASQAISIITDYFATAHDDLEITSPFPLQSCLTPTENYLRVAALLTNESLYREANAEEYQNGLEILALYYTERECAFIQVGQPSCILSRKGQHLFPLSSQMDLAMEVGAEQTASPLPGNLLGLDPSAYIEVKSFRPRPGDELFFISRSELSGRLFSLPEKERNLDRMTEVLAQDDEDQPFWLGHLKL